jgi:hypothetical protein
LASSGAVAFNDDGFNAGLRQSLAKQAFLQLACDEQFPTVVLISLWEGTAYGKALQSSSFVRRVKAVSFPQWSGTICSMASFGNISPAAMLR